MYYQWKEGYPFWLERGFVGNMCAQTLLQKKDKLNILDLCCGDGFYSKYFYAYSAKQITCIDFDEKAIETATKKNASSNIKHILGDIRYDLPNDKFDLIIWDAAFEHFTISESKELITKIKSSLVAGGILACYTIQEKDDKQKQLSHHEYEPKSKEDFASFFKDNFRNINVFETIYPVRHNLYLVASDSIIPFSDNWPMMMSNNKRVSN